MQQDAADARLESRCRIIFLADAGRPSCSFACISRGLDGLDEKTGDGQRRERRERRAEKRGGGDGLGGDWGGGLLLLPSE